MSAEYTPAWERITGTLFRCSTHDREFDAEGVYPCGPDRFAHGICPECSRNPKRPADVVLPDYWRPTRFGQPTRPALTCDYHAEIFETDEACRRCVLEDAEDELNSEPDSMDGESPMLNMAPVSK